MSTDTLEQNGSANGSESYPVLWLPPAAAAAVGRPSNPVPSDASIEGVRPGIRKVNPAKEYVARSQGVFWQNYRDALQRLPRPTDDLDRQLGCDTIRKMMQDPQINSSIYLAGLACLSRGLRVKPRITDKKNPKYALAVKYQQFIEYNLSSIQNSFTETLLDMLVSAMSVGNSVAEQTWRLQEGGEWDGKLVLDSIKPKPPEVYAFVVDKFGNTVGIATYTGAESYKPQFVQTQGQQVVFASNEVSSDWQVIPLAKFAILTHRKRNGDPRGQSALRPAYGAWVLLMQLWPEYLKYLTQFASPSIVGTTPEKAFPTVNPETNELEDPLDVMYNELLNFANGTVIAVRYGSEIDLKWSQGEGMAFVSAINILNNQMVKAILHQLLATEEGKHMARAASSTHQDVLNIAVRGLKNLCVSMVQRQIFNRLIELNFGKVAAETLTPYCSLGDVAQEDKADMVSSYGQAGYTLGAKQFPGIDAELELEVRSVEEAEKDLKAAKPAPAAGPFGKKPGATPAKPGSKPTPGKPGSAKTKPAPAKTPAKAGFLHGLFGKRAISLNDDYEEDNGSDEE